MTAGEWVAIIVALAGAITGIGSFLIAWSRNKGEKERSTVETDSSRADVARKYEEMAARQAVKISEMQVKIDTLECKVEELEHALAERDVLLEEWQAGISLLTNQIIANGQKPVWKPKEHRKNVERPAATG